MYSCIPRSMLLPKSYFDSPLPDLDECASSTDNNCDKDATCTNTEGSFTCECNVGFLDQSPSLPGKPGRLCVGKLLDLLLRCSHTGDP